jgi:uncharacterized protein (TIGR02679 family)
MRGLDECVAWLQQDSGFSRLMDGLFDMYVRYERSFGAVRLNNPSSDEERAISEFFKRDYYDQALIRIGLAEFERQAQRRFSHELTLSAILEAYTRRPLFLRRPDHKVTSNAFAMYLENDLTTRYVGTDAEMWVKDLVQHMRRSYRAWTEGYAINPASVTEPLEAICEVLTNLPFFSHERERLSDFAKRYINDPHAYDYNGKYGAYFMRALSKTLDVSVPVSAEEFSSLCWHAGLLSEGVLNRVLVRGLTADFGGAPDEICAVYNKRREPHSLTLENMSGYTSVKAEGGKVFIIESMTVFSAVNEQTRDSNRTVICASNGLNAALVFLLDMLTAGGAELHYSGSMDYRGLSLADKIYLKYPKAFKPWRYDKSDYERIVSENDFYLPDSKKDMGLHNEDLASLLSYMRKKGKTAPQAALIKDLVEDIMASASH